ncbi:MAG: hypothetical protein QXX08_00910 [Candidatus Bathyarchaeia archaeon]
MSEEDISKPSRFRNQGAPREKTLPPLPGESKVEIEFVDREKERINVLESINFLNRRLEKIEDRKRQLSEELEYTLRLESLSKSLKEQYARRLIETDNAIHSRLGIELEKPKVVEYRKDYPIRGVLAIATLMVIVGIIILLPFEVPHTLKFVFGTGVFLVGFATSVISLLQFRKRVASEK